MFIRRLVQLFLLLSLGPVAQAEIKPRIHKMCLKASDYAGCVESHSTIQKKNRTPNYSADLFSEKLEAAAIMALNKCLAKKFQADKKEADAADIELVPYRLVIDPDVIKTANFLLGKSDNKCSGESIIQFVESKYGVNKIKELLKYY
jgi:hypothetical protein